MSLSQPPLQVARDARAAGVLASRCSRTAAAGRRDGDSTAWSSGSATPGSRPRLAGVRRTTGARGRPSIGPAEPDHARSHRPARHAAHPAPEGTCHRAADGEQRRERHRPGLDGRRLPAHARDPGSEPAARHVRGRGAGRPTRPGRWCSPARRTSERPRTCSSLPCSERGLVVGEDIHVCFSPDPGDHGSRHACARAHASNHRRRDRLMPGGRRGSHRRHVCRRRSDADARGRRAQTLRMTEEPWPKRPWLAVIPTFASSTCRPSA